MSEADAKKKYRKITGSQTFVVPPEDIHLITISPNNVRFQVGPDWQDSGLDEKWVQELAVQIAHDGQDDPVVVRQLSDDSHEIVEGRHRIAAVEKINKQPEAFGIKEPVPLFCRTEKLDDLEALRRSFSANNKLRVGPMDKSKAFHMAQKKHGLSDHDTAVLFRMSEQTIKNSLRLQLLPHSMQCLLHTKQISEPIAQKFLSLKMNEKEMKKTAAKLADGSMDQAALSVAVADKKRQDAGEKAEGEGEGAAPRCYKRSVQDMRSDLSEINNEAARLFLDYMSGKKTKEEMCKIFTDDVSKFFSAQPEIENGDEDGEGEGRDVSGDGEGDVESTENQQDDGVEYRGQGATETEDPAEGIIDEYVLGQDTMDAFKDFQGEEDPPDSATDQDDDND